MLSVENRAKNFVTSRYLTSLQSQKVEVEWGADFASNSGDLEQG